MRILEQGGVDQLGDIFVSYASADAALAVQVCDGIRRAGHRVFRDSDRDDGIAPGVAWQRTLFHELRCCDAVVFLNSPASQNSMWCHTELAVAVELGKRVYSLDLASGLRQHPLLAALQGIRWESSVDAGVGRLAESLRLDGLAGGTAARWERDRPPYPGLAALDVADAGVFFGRDDEIRGLAARVDGPLGARGGELTVMLGPSGAGKSSLLRAGLVARLRVPLSGWLAADPFEPGARPLDRLAGRLAALVPGQLSAEECRQRLLEEGLGVLAERLIGHAGPGARRLLVTVDQAEQLATVTLPRDTGDFLSVLGTALGPGAPVTVVLAARSDRFEDIQRLPVIGPLVQAPFVIAPLGRAELAAVIEKPAARADLSFAPGLVPRLIDDATRGSHGEAVDALPLLATTW